ncbi:hypothetical protein HZ326_16911 [Fusarium oxysporum f. sp. albedinis]|nr:hypothetical protein HZ326_16911 [Fusarium oxysporum f. sp. albedinis]
MKSFKICLWSIIKVKKSQQKCIWNNAGYQHAFCKHPLVLALFYLHNLHTTPRLHRLGTCIELSCGPITASMGMFEVGHAYG